MDSVVKKIVIVGGGTAGWMTAACFAKALGTHFYDITLVESEEIGTVGVGEATIPAIIEFNNFLGIDENEFVRETNGTFKLGIEFVDWRQKGVTYFHPFGLYGFDIAGFTFPHYYFRHYIQRGGGPVDIGKYNAETEAASQGRFGRVKPEVGKPTVNYAYQFDASLYARFLRRYAETRGVVRQEGKIVQVHQNPETGYVTSVQLTDGRHVEGDIFIDCSGFRGLLIEETLKTGYIDWSRWLPMNRAAAVPCERVDVLTPFTRCTAREAGWQWRIPLQHRTGNGYVFCSDFISEDEAAATVLTRLDGKALADPKILRFVTGRRKKAWNKNVVALGLASGFLEPLESTSIHLVQSGAFKFLALFPRHGINPHIVDEYNRQVELDYENIKDFIIAHYKVTERDDTPFWRHVQQMSIPDSLQARFDVFRATSQTLAREPELFREVSWVAILTGQGMIPEDYHPAADALDDDDLRLQLGRWRSAVLERVKPLPLHEDYIRRNCASEALKMLYAG
ncbi:tryptophan halogenase family protein [Asticcacaulis solisilvae]|uniref:tryptophan halogenase family protein n=1 Tax=Asticcacaulis solisilvae TaxID=1217274 RepID=UPI003FD76FBA